MIESPLDFLPPRCRSNDRPALEDVLRVLDSIVVGEMTLTGSQLLYCHQSPVDFNNLVDSFREGMGEKADEGPQSVAEDHEHRRVKPRLGRNTVPRVKPGGAGGLRGHIKAKPKASSTPLLARLLRGPGR